MWNQNNTRGGSWQSSGWGPQSGQSQYAGSQYDQQSWQGSQYDVKSKTSKQSVGGGSIAPYNNNNNNDQKRGRAATSIMSNAAKKSVINSTFDKQKLSVVSAPNTSRKLSSVSLATTAIAPMKMKGRPNLYPTSMPIAERRRTAWPGLDPNAGPGAPPLTVGFHPGNPGRAKLWRGQPVESIEAEYEAKRQWRMERQKKWADKDKEHNPHKIPMARDPNKKISYMMKKRPSWPGVEARSDPPVTKGFKPDARGRHLKYRDAPPEILANEEEQRIEHKRVKQRAWCAKQRAKPGYVSPNKTGRPIGRPRMPDHLKVSMKKRVRKTAMKAPLLGKKNERLTTGSSLALKAPSRVQSKQSVQNNKSRAPSKRAESKQNVKGAKQSAKQSARPAKGKHSFRSKGKH